jgi:rod shape-determining protein MreD
VLVSRARDPGRIAEDRRLMSLLLAAVGATAAAVLELSVGPYLRVGDAHLHLVLVLGVVWTVTAGVEAGLTWAFVGGLFLDVLAQRPLGASAFALLVCLGGTAVLARFLSRFRPIAPIVAVLIFSVVYSMTLFVLFGALGSRIPDVNPVSTILPSSIYDAVVAAVIGPLAVSIHDRRTEQERVDW